MNARVRWVAVVLVVASVFGSTPGLAGAQSVDDARRQVEQIVDELEQLSDDAVRLGEAYEEALADLDTVQAEVADLDQQIVALEAQIGSLQTAVGALAMDVFVRGDQGGGLGTLLVSSGTVNDATERHVYLELTASASTSSIDQYEAVNHDLDKTRAQRKAKQTRVERAIEAAKEQQAAVEEKTKQYEKLRESAQAKLGQAIVAEQRRREAEAERAAAATRASQVRSTPRTPSIPAAAASTRGAATPGGTPAPQAPPPAGTPEVAPNEPAPAEEPAAPAPADEPADSPPADPAPAPEPEPQPEPEPPRSRAGADVPAPSPGASGAVEAAMSQLGVPYRYATAKPGVSFDCSGLTAWAWGQAGVSLPHYSKAQFEMLPQVPADQAQPGDLIFYRNPVGHVAMYIGNGQMIHAPRTGDVVKISTVNWGKVRDGVVGRPG